MPILGSFASGSRRGFNAGKGGGVYPFTTFTFQSIVAAGSSSGPSLSQMQTAYAGQPWLSSYFALGSYNGYQRWTAPATDTYIIEAGGAMGGDGLGPGYSSGLSITTLAYGAKITGSFMINALDVIEIVVGVKGGSSGGAHGNENGGGGATWIKNITQNKLLLVAGGGGGAPSATYGTACARTLSSGQGQSTQAGGGLTGCYTTVATPTLGYGGNCAGNGNHGAAGGGYLSAGGNGGAHCSTAYGGGYYGNGLVGGAGNTCYDPRCAGGFGGGGGGMLGSPGGAGGYTGGSATGSWSDSSTYGGGGGSYTDGGASSVTSIAGGNTGSLGGYTGSGYCKITLG